MLRNKLLIVILGALLMIVVVYNWRFFSGLSPKGKKGRELMSENQAPLLVREETEQSLSERKGSLNSMFKFSRP